LQKEQEKEVLNFNFMNENNTEQKEVKTERPERRGDRNARGGRRERRDRVPRVKPEFDEKMLALKRVARVSKGGRRFNFSAAVVVGNRRGAVGAAIGKGADTSLAMEKASRNAKKYAIRPNLTENLSIPHDVRAKYSSAIVEIRPAVGRGLVAGSATRTVLEFAGIKDVSAKVLSGSKNKYNIAQATIKALSALKNKK
jgi:small subunit ribosomal protein S5